MKPIYKPKGKAAEYGDYALNIYSGCSHRCFYCYCPNVLHKDRDGFHDTVEPRKDILEETKRQIEREGITGKTIHLCFTCDPYPYGHDSLVTRGIIQLLKQTGNHVQILTKNGIDAMRDFDLLDSEDWFGITWAGYSPLDWKAEEGPRAEPGSAPLYRRIQALSYAHECGIKTWVSCEPVLNEVNVIETIKAWGFVDLWKIGKLNYHPSDIDWKSFGKAVESVCERLGRDYYIKESLRKEMEK